jgi:hypothetical protein
MNTIPERIEIKVIPNRQDIRKFSEKLEHFGQKNTIGCYVNPRTHKFETNLTDEDIKYLQGLGFPYDLTDTYINGKAHPFWDSSVSKITLLPSTVILRPKDNPLDFVKYKYLLKSKYIYVSEADMNKGHKSEATHYIYNEEEEIVIKASSIEKRDNLIKKISKLSLQRKRDFILILLNENTENKDSDYVTVRIEDILQNKDLTSKLENLLASTDADVEITTTIRKAIQANVLSRTKAGYYYFETNLGFQEEDVKEFLMKEEHQEVLINIQSKIK